MTNQTDSIHKSIELKAPVSRVWRALTDYREFGAWFRVTLETPFVAGETCSGFLGYPGYEHLRMEVVVQRIEPERLFSFTWHPYVLDTSRDYSDETPTLVEFRFESIPDGTLLTVTESGFDRLPPERRAEAFRMNEGGWTQQVQNIAAYVSA